jgi:hypothetical protein
MKLLSHNPSSDLIHDEQLISLWIHRPSSAFDFSPEFGGYLEDFPLFPFGCNILKGLEELHHHKPIIWLSENVLDVGIHI